jgi:hypothetical protein
MIFATPTVVLVFVLVEKLYSRDQLHDTTQLPDEIVEAKRTRAR